MHSQHIRPDNSDAGIHSVPLSRALGVEYKDLATQEGLTAAEISSVQKALLEDHLVCITSDPLDAEQYARLAEHFGEPQTQLLRDHRHPQVPVVSVFDSSYATIEDKPKNLMLDRRSGWHTDDSYFAKPAKITLLQALSIPSSGGQTRFCNARRAYEDLDAEMKQYLLSLSAVHAYDTKRAPARAVKRSLAEAQETPDVLHPLIRTHEDSAYRAIYFNSNRTDRIQGMTRDESDELLDFLHAHMTQEKYQYHHEWRVGDILIWDNRCVTHSVNMDFPIGESRIHQRILLAGTKPR